MDSNFDLSQYSDREIIRLQKEKKKEYIVLIQSERIAKKLLNSLGESLFTTNYHYRLNAEYYMINERVAKKKIMVDDEEVIVKIPRTSIICRLLESKNVLLKNGSESYERYSDVIDELVKKLSNMPISIIYKDGDLYFVNIDNTEVLIDDNTFNEYFDIAEKKQLKK